MASTTLKIIQIGLASLWCLLSAGIVFGFAAFKTILIGEKVYQEYCPTKSLGPCTEQDLKLNFIFTLAAGITNIVALPVGWTLDHYGPRFSGVVGALWLGAGAAMYVWSKQLSSILDPYLIGYSMFAVGGPFVFISSFQLANSFPNRSGSVLSLITGTFDCSSALFLVYRIVYQHWNGDLHLSRFFQIYMLVPLFILVTQLTVMPKDSYKTQAALEKIFVEHLDENGQLLEGESASAFCSDEEERRSLLNEDALRRNEDALRGVGADSNSKQRRKSVLEVYVERRLERKSGGMFGLLHDQPVSQQISNPLFYLMAIFVTVCMLRINYFVATVRSQEEYLLGDPELALKMNHIFDIALPLGGVVAIPLTGFILDNMGTYNILITVFTTSVTVGILGLIPGSFIAQLIGILILVVYRPFYYTVLSDYISKVFGFDTFGTVYGLLVCVSGSFNMVQSVLDKLTHTTFGMNPTPINILLVLATVFSGMALLWEVRQQLKKRVYEVNTRGSMPSSSNSYNST
ncbi:probable protein FMP42 [Zygosaccharomyces bailii]|nr:probable protein FMP42 [Zygosaccharomyces bailii]